MSRIPTSPTKAQAFLDCINKMAQSGVIVPVPPSETFSGFYSNLFLVPKKDGSFRPVLDLKFLNKYIRSVRFKMETLRSVIRGMESREFLMSLDIKDAYLHVPIWPPHHRFLRFAFKNRHFQFVALPFGLTSAPRVFTKLMAVTAAALRLQGISVTPYLDDLLLKASTAERSEEDLRRAIVLLQEFGWTINWKKSNLVPSHQMTFLGLEFNTLTQRVFLPLDKQEKIRSLSKLLLHSVSYCSSGHESPGIHGVHHRGGTLCSTSPTPPSSQHSSCLEGRISPSEDDSPTLHQAVSSVVAQAEQSFQGSILGHTGLDGSHDRRQSPGVGSNIQLPVRTRSVVSRGVQTLYQHPRTPRCKVGAPSLVLSSPGQSDKSPKRQLHHSRIHKPSGRNPQQSSASGSSANSKLGRIQCGKAVRHSHPGSRQHQGRLPQPQSPGPRGMGASPGSLCGSRSSLGASANRPDGLQEQPQSQHFLRPLPGSSRCRSRRHDTTLAVRPGLHLPASSHVTAGAKEDQVVPCHSHCHSSILAQKNVVLGSPGHVHSTARSLSPQARSAPPGSHLPPQPGPLRFDGLAIEAAIWQRQSRKPTSSKAYHRVWRNYWNWCNDTAIPISSPFSFTDCNIPRVLSFLQRGLQLGLKLSSLKVQVSALSVLFQHRLALDDSVRTFLQGVAHISPPFRPPVPGWDLNTVLDALLDPPFEPLGTVSEQWLTWKVVFLVAISSTRRVSELGALSCDPAFLVFHKDKAVLRTLPSFLPKVVSSFHINQEIVLPSLCPDPKNDKERRLHGLDVVRALRWYIQRSKDFRLSQNLFVLPSGARRGLAASKASIARWLRETIRQAYLAKGKSPPEGVRAHSTRSVGASWAWRNSASLDQICRAATWSSVHTFTKFYKIDTFSSAEAAFGRKVLHSVVQ
ncbi:uncharacterized protein LOC121395599 [Xenopus laevis]|uniref:ribonuclease H n=1 Tax=Xenopus laevis TaxID=8355 RepID=A0A8J1L8U5_XENLA|nr:uncharacterized protein LOC121395599 [Xenopus laevis]